MVMRFNFKIKSVGADLKLVTCTNQEKRGIFSCKTVASKWLTVVVIRVN